MRVRVIVLSVIGLVLLGCSGLLDNSAERIITEMQLENARLESEVTELEQKLQQCQAKSVPPTEEQEQQAQELIKQIKDDVNAFRYEAAKKKLAEFKARYSRTRSARSLTRTQAELDLIGADAGPLQVEKWFQGSAMMGDGQLMLLVFFEQWCPHCRRHLPESQQQYERLRAQGLRVVGLTKLSKSSTEENVMQLVRDNGVTYPIGKEDGSLSTRFAVRGIPAAALVRDGKVVWRGHPARLKDEHITQFLREAAE